MGPIEVFGAAPAQGNIAESQSFPAGRRPDGPSDYNCIWSDTRAAFQIRITGRELGPPDLAKWYAKLSYIHR
jgi:hypothetical protein